MKEILEKLESLQSVCVDIHNIITRNDWTNGEICDLIALQNDFRNAIIEVKGYGNYQRILELLTHSVGGRIYARHECLTHADIAEDFYSAWIMSLKECEFGAQSDLMSEHIIIFARSLFYSAMSEIRLTIDQIKLFAEEAQNAKSAE